jgi:hypothetical protein
MPMFIVGALMLVSALLAFSIGRFIKEPVSK